MSEYKYGLYPDESAVLEQALAGCVIDESGRIVPMRPSGALRAIEGRVIEDENDTEAQPVNLPLERKRRKLGNRSLSLILVGTTLYGGMVVGDGFTSHRAFSDVANPVVLIHDAVDAANNIQNIIQNINNMSKTLGGSK